jgi:asparagine synthase (glutamine-hydrolysing)
MISDVPISYLLSGGVDSSLICYLAGRQSKIDSYYLGYDSEDRNFEELSEYLSRKIDSNHNIVRMKPPIFSEALNQMIKLFDEPFGDYSALPSYEIYRTISQKTKVAISGDGADEIFAGYKDAQLFYLRTMFNLNNKFDQGPINEKLMYTLNSKSKLIRYLGYLTSVIFLNEGSLSTSTSRGGWNHAYRKMIMTKDGYERTGGSYTEDKEINDYNNAGDNPLERYLNYDLKRLTYDFLVKVDRTSMANSLEVRSPFLDTKLLENLSRANIKSIVDHRQTKKELKAILNTFGLEELTKVKKQGFTPPLLSWMLTDTGINEVRKIHDDHFINQLFDRKKLIQMTNTKANISKNQSRLWFLMILSKWHTTQYS